MERIEEIYMVFWSLHNLLDCLYEHDQFASRYIWWYGWIAEYIFSESWYGSNSHSTYRESSKRIFHLWRRCWSWAQECDILNHSFDWEYDAFVCMRVLHFLESDEAKYIIQKMQNHTKPGWFNALTFFTDATPHNPKWFFPNLEDVTTLYCDWRLLIVSDPITSSPSETTWWREMVSVSCLFQKI